MNNSFKSTLLLLIAFTLLTLISVSCKESTEETAAADSAGAKWDEMFWDQNNWN